MLILIGVLAGGFTGYWCTSTLGGIGVAMCGTAFGISAGTVTVIGTVGGVSLGFVSGIVLERQLRRLSSRERDALFRALVKEAINNV